MLSLTVQSSLYILIINAMNLFFSLFLSLSLSLFLSLSLSLFLSLSFSNNELQVSYNFIVFGRLTGLFPLKEKEAEEEAEEDKKDKGKNEEDK